MLHYNRLQMTNTIDKRFYLVSADSFDGFTLLDSLFTGKNTLQIQFSNFFEGKNIQTIEKSHREQQTNGSQPALFVQLSDDFGFDSVLPRNFKMYI